MCDDEDDEVRYKRLFDEVDKNQDGSIEISELIEALKRFYGVGPSVEKHAQEIMEKADKDRNNKISFTEFVQFLEEHEQRLCLAFSHLDRNHDGRIDAEEVQAAFKELDLVISIEEAENLTKKINKDGLYWEEWRNFFQLYPSSELSSMITFWKKSLMIDLGESSVPPDFTNAEKVTGIWWKLFLSGGIAGFVSRTATAPLDRVKIVYQVHGSKVANKGLFIVVKRLLEEGGVKSMWRGNGTNVLKIAPDTAIKFLAYEYLKKYMIGEEQRDISIKERFLAGSMAGSISQTCVYPLEVIKTRLAIATSGQYNGIVDCFQKIYKHEGIKAFYKGYWASLAGILPYAGIDLATYETLRTLYLRKNPDIKYPGLLIMLGCGTISSSLGQLVTYPLALIRTRLQAGVTRGDKNNFFSLAKHIIKHEGPLGLYRGIAPNFMKVLPAVGISYVVYEKSKIMLDV